MNSEMAHFLNFAESFISACFSLSSDKKWASPSSFLRYMRLRKKYRVFLDSSFVAMATHYVTLMSATC